MTRGWISVHRSIQDHWIWLDEPFTRGQAWIDLILLANYEDKKILFNGELVKVERGSKITSLRYLSERWKWSTWKVKKFLSLLESDGMIIFKTDSKKTTYTIVNYNIYQDIGGDRPNTNQTQTKHRPNTNQTQTKTNNNINNINNINKDIVLQNYPYKEIIDYLNLKTNKNYRFSTTKNKELIRARMNEGFKLEDFKKVIDNKVSSWKGDSKMEQYLRPVTLFGNKFESYLNESVKAEPQISDVMRKIYEEGGLL